MHTYPPQKNAYPKYWMYYDFDPQSSEVWGVMLEKKGGCLCQIDKDCNKITQFETLDEEYALRSVQDKVYIQTRCPKKRESVAIENEQTKFLSNLSGLIVFMINHYQNKDAYNEYCFNSSKGVTVKAVYTYKKARLFAEGIKVGRDLCR